MSKLNLFNSSVGRKFVMALTGIFLVIFLLVHLSVNLTLFAGKEAFESASHFMGTNPIIQSMQYILALGFLIHIVMGIRLEIQNRNARSVSYIKENYRANTPASSKYMIYSGLLVLLFLIIHLKNYFVPMKFQGVKDNHYDFVVELFKNPIYVIIYVISFIFLSIHLSHGIKSSFQSMGLYHRKYNNIIKNVSIAIFWIIGIGFSSISLYFYFFN